MRDRHSAASSGMPYNPKATIPAELAKSLAAAGPAADTNESHLPKIPVRADNVSPIPFGLSGS